MLNLPAFGIGEDSIQLHEETPKVPSLCTIIFNLSGEGLEAWGPDCKRAPFHKVVRDQGSLQHLLTTPKV